MGAPEIGAGVRLAPVLAAAFVLAGALRVISAVIHPVAGRGWALLGGFISVVLGLALWQGWPASGLWVIGLFVGLDLAFNGWAWVLAGLLGKTPPRQSGPRSGLPQPR
jgi:uncharacterized membrane protein HdeD (DUF308 family)